MRITAATHPNLFRAMLHVAYANGAINRERPEPSEYNDMPDRWEPDGYRLAEEGLATLNLDDFENFCDGEATDIEAIARRSPGLTLADEILIHFFLEVM